MRAEDGQSFAASFALFLDEIGDPPTLDEQINVVFDPVQRSDVWARVAWRQPTPADSPAIRWQVPAHCPNCGAIVDQSTESLAAHPACAMGHQPLPCEPVT